MLDGIGGALATIFWGLLLLSVLVFIHEGGHFLAARILKIRVREFFLGLPFRYNLHVDSKRYGTRYGVTPLLLGGYTLVCGMEQADSPHLADALMAVQKGGRVTVDEVADAIGTTHDEALQALVTLNDWAAIEPYYDIEAGEKPSQSYYPEHFQTLERDGALRTKYDRGHDFGDGATTAEGEPRVPNLDAEAFLVHERKHTYQAHGFWARTFVLVSGAAVNIICGLLLVVAVLTLHGVYEPSDTSTLGGVLPESAAAEAGLQAGDTITAVEGTPVTTWTELVDALDPLMQDGTAFTLTYEREGATHEAIVAITQPLDQLGIQGSVELMKLNVGEAFQFAASYVAQTAAYIAQLFQPQNIAGVIENSTSVVGISVMARDAASEGAASLALLAAAVSLSLGFMNLLPVPPLDGGKIVIEAIQAVIGRPISARVQAYISYVGIALFMLLFFVLLRQDVIRFIFGG